MAKPIFHHPCYTLQNDEKVVRNTNAPAPTRTEDAEVMQELARYVEARLMVDFGLISIQIPEDQDPSTTILASPDFGNASKLLIIIQNAYGSQLGIFSRSLCFDEGISKGTWLPYIERATAAGYAVMILRPNTNSILVERAGEAPEKIPIIGSESPEIHVLNVWANVIPRAEKVNHIALLSYGNGASLCKDLYLREMVDNGLEGNRIKGFVTIEASHIIEKDDAGDIRDALGRIAVNMESNASNMGYRLGYRKENLGCICVSLGLPAGVTEVKNVASSVSLAMNPVFKYLTIAESGGNVSKNFANIMARENGLDANTAVIMVNPHKEQEIPPAAPASQTPSQSPQVNDKQPGFFARLFGSRTASTSNKSKNEEEKLTVADFDLLKIVGKGAFGKVMLVRKKNSTDEGKVYAMKVLRKDVIAAKGQIEHTKSERDILYEIRHPYIVRLRYAFQSDDKLYLVTDYYNGGTLFYHLRKSRQFSEERARFYAAELLLALEHLHKNNIIYRDLKLENILMDHQGHLALTDFGLSKQNIDVTGGATTFCGTAEYIAPELLRGQKYGAAVDWWSFGILLFEMIYGRTPFFDKNRKVMFYRIMHTEPSFPSSFSPEVIDCIRGLLRVNENERLGSGPRGAEEVKGSGFFRVINFDALFRREVTPPFIPEVVNEFDTKYVPKAYLQAEAKDSVDETAKKRSGKKKEQNPAFEQFTFSGDRSLDC
eukprot:gene11443-12795_t